MELAIKCFPFYWLFGWHSSHQHRANTVNCQWESPNYRHAHQVVMAHPCLWMTPCWRILLGAVVTTSSSVPWSARWTTLAVRHPCPCHCCPVPRRHTLRDCSVLANNRRVTANSLQHCRPQRTFTFRHRTFPEGRHLLWLPSLQNNSS